MATTDLETCSWCTDEVPDEELIEQPDGARVCQSCLWPDPTFTVYGTHTCCGDKIYFEDRL